jgi:hypothetical protein
MRASLFVPLILFGVGCNPGPPPAKDNAVPVFDVPRQQVEGARFKIETAGRFRAGYENNEREILIITDSANGRQYIGITGVGVTELHSEMIGKSTAIRER